MMKPSVLGTATVLVCACLARGFADERPLSDSPTLRELPGDGDTAAEESKPPSAFLHVDDQRFFDAEGRQVLLHGMNVISKSKDEGYLSWHRAEDFAKMRAWGMNCIRLGIIWDGIEPEPGKYDEAYLDGVAKRVAWAAEHGLFVFLDMHQDLFSVLYGDGVPAWATLHENRPHRQGGVWSDAYLLSPAVQTSFDNFWANAPAADGVGIQDRYAAAWRHVANRFAKEPTVIGYDLMNEPFQGTSILAAQIVLLSGRFGTRLGELLGKSVGSPAQIAELWKQPEGRAVIMKHLDDMGLYGDFLDAQTGISQAFERRRLQGMHQRVAHAIREVDSQHVLLLEPSYACNVGVCSAIESVVGPDGSRDARQAYAPHAYDIVVDTPAMANANPQRIVMIFDRHRKTAERLKMPLIIGEWGAFGAADERILDSARVLQRELEKRLCGDTYWEYEADIENRAYFGVLKRSIPSRIAGVLLEYSSHPETGGFACRWRESPEITAPTILYLTEASFKNRTVRLEPPGSGFEVSPASDTSGDVYLFVRPTGRSVERSLTSQ
ncbi:MAG TPA: hypothetical protein DD670_03350 [Planctomycetaceae bacterium]|nr:hypothetical protein [Planctomycetaceae bacterium]